MKKNTPKIPIRYKLLKSLIFIFILSGFSIGLIHAKPIINKYSPLEDYCTPGSSPSFYIKHFSTSGGMENIDHSITAGPVGGYADYTDTHSVSQYSTMEIGFNANFSTALGYKIWIDWNQDGEFSEDEVVYSTSSAVLSVSSVIEVPEDAMSGTTTMRMGVNFLDPTGPENACVEDFFTSFQDFSFEVLPLVECEGTPDAGTVDTEMLVCPNIDFYLIAEGASSPGSNMTRVWQSSPAGEDNWTDIENSDNANFNLAGGVDEPTDFRFKLQCDDGDIVYSDIIEVVVKSAEECYCTPGSSTIYYVNDFTTSDGQENIEHEIDEAPDAGYGDFTETQTVSQHIAQTIDFEVSASTNSLGYRIWVDWNRDGHFSEDEIVFNTSSYVASASGTIEVPEGAVVGNTILRVGVHYLNTSGPQNPCMIDGNTSFQDFTFEVLPLEDCDGMPDAGEPVETEIAVCPGDPFTLEIENISDPANNLYRRWQFSPAGEDNWTDIDNSYQTSLTIEDGITAATDYRYAMTCNDEDSDYSDIISVSLNPATECYCIPTGTTNNPDEIINFSLNDFSNDSEPSEGTNGYSDYSDLGPITLTPGVGYIASITVGSGTGSHGAAIWIDYNDDGIFSEDEKVAYIPNIILANTTVEFPEFIASNVPGEHRLRVQYSFYQDGAELDPCGIFNPGASVPNGETEDYTILIEEPDCFPPIDVDFNYITDNSAQVVWEANEETQWQVTYGLTDFDPETEGETLTVTEPLANLAGLDVDTSYDVYVQTVCDSENSIVMGPYSFTTNVTPPENTRLCDAIELIPNNGCSGTPYTNVDAFNEVGEPVGSCLNNFHGTNTVWFSFVAINTEAVVTTDFDVTNFSTEIVVFEAPTDCSDLSSLGEEIGCANSFSSGTVELEDLTVGETYYIQIAGFSNAEGVFCLEVQMEEMEICLDPTDIQVDEIEETYVEVSWTAGGNESQWEVLYGLAGFDMAEEGDSVIVNSPAVTINDLEAETDYEVYVRAICGDDNSDWIGPETFTTKEMSLENQIFTDFNFNPNPVENSLNLTAGDLIEKVEIFNLLGQKVMDIHPNQLKISVDTEKLQSGTYLMKVTIEGAHKTFRVIRK